MKQTRLDEIDEMCDVRDAVCGTPDGMTHLMEGKQGEN